MGKKLTLLTDEEMAEAMAKAIIDYYNEGYLTAPKSPLMPQLDYIKANAVREATYKKCMGGK